MENAEITVQQRTDIGMLKEHQAGVRAADLCRKYGISGATSYKWSLFAPLMVWMAPASSFTLRQSEMSLSQTEKPLIEEVTTVGIDLAKNVFQIHGVDKAD